jgi:hypothetical protein
MYTEMSCHVARNKRSETKTPGTEKNYFRNIRRSEAYKSNKNLNFM